MVDRTSHLIRTLLGAMLVSALLVPYVAAQETGPKIATVSLAKLQANYDELAAQEQTLGRWLEERRSHYNEAANYVFLSQKDFEAALELLQKPRPLSDENKQRLEDLRSISDQRDRKFSDLRAKANRTAEENAEFNTLQEMYDARVQTLQELRQQITQELNSRRESALSGLMDKVQTAVVETAQGLGYDFVFDADAVFLGGDDITDAVLERLNGSAEEGTPEEDTTGEQQTEEETEEQESPEQPADEDGADEEAEGGGGDEGGG